MTTEQATHFTCDEDDCGTEEFMADSDVLVLPMGWTEDEEADQHRCGACSNEKGALSEGSFRAETAAMAGRAT